MVDVAALQHNYSVVRKLAPHSRILSIVKAGGYGHGLVQVAKALRNSDGFGVATLEEGLALREAGITQPILLLEGLLNQADLQLAAEKRFQLVVHQDWQVKMLESAKLSQPVSVWLKVNTGMHRLGVSEDSCLASWRQLQQSPNVRDLVLMSHLACADDAADAMNQAQLRLFAGLAEGCSANSASLANSAGVINGADFHYQWVRPGLMLYGGTPVLGTSAAELQLKPAMQLVSRVIARTQVRAGESVGYGATWRAKKDAEIAVVAIGYGDGYPRHISHEAQVLVNGTRCPIVGRVSMDMITIDVTHMPQVTPETEVVLWGEGLPLEEVADWAGTVNYELLCQITGRVERQYVDSALPASASGASSYANMG